MRDCKDYREDISLLLDGELPEDRREVLMRHLADCPRCQAELAAYSAISAALAPEEPPAELHNQIMARVLPAAAAKRKRRRMRLLRAALPTAACFLLLMGLWSAGLPRMRSGGAAPETYMQLEAAQAIPEEEEDASEDTFSVMNAMAGADAAGAETPADYRYRMDSEEAAPEAAETTSADRGGGWTTTAEKHDCGEAGAGFSQRDAYVSAENAEAEAAAVPGAAGEPRAEGTPERGGETGGWNVQTEAPEAEAEEAAPAEDPAEWEPPVPEAAEPEESAPQAAEDDAAPEEDGDVLALTVLGPSEQGILAEIRYDPRGELAPGTEILLLLPSGEAEVAAPGAELWVAVRDRSGTDGLPAVEGSLLSP